MSLNNNENTPLPGIYGRILANRANAHNHSHDCESHAKEPAIQNSLYEKINKDLVVCYNEAVRDSGKTVFKPSDMRFDMTLKVASDADEELLFYIPFTGQVKIKSIWIWGGAGNSAPNHVKLIINRNDVDFDNVNDLELSQEFALVEGVGKPVEYPTRISRFSNVRELNMYFSGNFGADSTEIFYIGFTGEWMQSIDRPVVTVYETSGMLSDHKHKVFDGSISRSIQ
ncbi:hypothetical protein BB561_002121 [Smittium simulii]|uniref:PITH domain-containing protein n=1 Tax=Smittium simulii TaxID=133385 RepID=A0A2T9YRR2_9FUNG|nr:hypothetical protein BB561_002121 [Smittium simulii]